MAQNGFQPDLTQERSQYRQRPYSVSRHQDLPDKGILNHYQLDDAVAKLARTYAQSPSESNIIYEFDFMWRGWGFVTGDGANPNQDATITLATQFQNDDYNVQVNVMGTLAGSDPTLRSDATALATQVIASARIIDETSFDIRIEDATGANLTNGTRYIYNWVARGIRTNPNLGK